MGAILLFSEASKQQVLKKRRNYHKETRWGGERLGEGKIFSRKGREEKVVWGKKKMAPSRSTAAIKLRTSSSIYLTRGGIRCNPRKRGRGEAACLGGRARPFDIGNFLEKGKRKRRQKSSFRGRRVDVSRPAFTVITTGLG